VGGSVVTGNTTNVTNITNVNASLAQNDEMQREALELQRKLVEDKRKLIEIKLRDDAERMRLEKVQKEQAIRDEELRKLQQREQSIREKAQCEIQSQIASNYVGLMNDRDMKKIKAFFHDHVSPAWAQVAKGYGGKVYNSVGYDGFIAAVKYNFDEKVKWYNFKVTSNTRNGIIFLITLYYPKTQFTWATQARWVFTEDGKILSEKYDPEGFD
jgi:hypothetical protein